MTTVLPGLVFAASPYLGGFDGVTKLTQVTAQQRHDQGYRFCVRYVARGAESSEDLSHDEACLILDAGLALMVVQHVRKPDWQPDLALGHSDGAQAAANASAIGLPAGVCLWMDLEGVASSSKANDVIAYCQAWYDEVSSAGYVPGVYVGAASGLTADELSALPFGHFWESASSVPTPSCGYQLTQMMTQGLIDPDFTSNDTRGRQASWLAAATPTYPTLLPGCPSEGAVAGLQRALNNAGASPRLSEDGAFGHLTSNAVKSFQSSVGLSPDGVVNGATWSALLGAS